jgi:predicted transcriptional regulator YdeE
MVFNAISRVFDLTDEQQYETIGQFWDEMAALYGLENLRGLGYAWQGNTLSYAIGLKDGNVKDCNVRISLPDDGWITAKGQTDRLKAIYDGIYQNGRLQYEIETFYEDGTCEINYYRVE